MRNLFRRIQKSGLGSTALRYSVLGFSGLRASHFAAQGVVLPLINQLIGRRDSTDERVVRKYRDSLKISAPKLRALFEKDPQNIVDGLYPISVLQPESWLRHSLRYPQIIMDALRAAAQRKSQRAKEFSPEARDFLDELPDYYKRNFHYQSNGYLAEASADLYDHQVEILFAGAADAMRRLLLPPLRTHFLESNGEGFHFLEIGSGTGRLTRQLALTYPKAQITCVDLSPHYLKKAQLNLRNFKRIDYLQGAGENLPFKDGSFDAVVSCFLFHELPQAIRQQVLLEAHRVLKAQGLFAMVDSIQHDDDPEMNWALEQFPKDFHEPFYRNYTRAPMSDLVRGADFKNVQSNHAFLAKVVTGVRTVKI
jgi:ubiquinone/menaquinone biosynthesis C-methylase UbiE